MGGLATFTIDVESRTAAQSACRWLPGFYPQIAIVLGEDTVELRSDCHEQAELSAIWTAALANEILHARGRERRGAAFEALAR